MNTSATYVVSPYLRAGVQGTKVVLSPLEGTVCECTNGFESLAVLDAFVEPATVDEVLVQVAAEDRPDLLEAISGLVESNLLIKKASPASQDQVVHVFIAIPPGVSDSIFRWGADWLKQYLLRTDLCVNVWTVDFALDSELRAAAREYGADCAAILDMRRGDLADSPVMRRSREGPRDLARLFRIAGWARGHQPSEPALHKAPSWQKRAADGRIPPPKAHEILGRVESVLRRRIDCLSRPSDAKRLWAVSVYSQTRREALVLANIIRAVDPGAALILGGDSFVPENAPEVFSDNPFIDGIAVGPGEDILSGLVAAMLAGSALRDVRIPGFVNARSAEVIDEQVSGDTLRLGLANERRNIEPPSFYHDSDKLSGMPWVKSDSDESIVVLTQRGCRYNKCRFCFCLGLNGSFHPPLEALLEQLGAALEASSQERPCTIQFCADQEVPEVIIPLLNLIRSSLAHRPEKPKVNFWMRASDVNAEFLWNLKSIIDSGVRVSIQASSESLSPTTLRRMRKGFTPIQFLAALKGLQDAGAWVSSDLFICYPQDDIATVREEVDVLRAAAHLFSNKLGRANRDRPIYPAIYFVNANDAIGRNPRRFGIRLKGRYGYERAWQWNAGYLCGTTYLWEKRAETSGRIRVAALWRKCLAAQCLVFGSNPFEERERLVDLFCDSRICLNNSAQGVDALNQRRFRLEIHDGKLTKDFNLDGRRDFVEVALGETQLAAYRYLYWWRKASAVANELKHLMGPEEGRRWLEEQVALGGVFCQSGVYLSLAHDPEFLAPRREVYTPTT